MVEKDLHELRIVGAHLCVQRRLDQAGADVERRLARKPDSALCRQVVQQARPDLAQHSTTSPAVGTFPRYYLGLCWRPIGPPISRRSNNSVAFGGLCRKSRKLQGHDFFAKTRNRKQSPIRIDAVALSKSPVNLTLGNEVPHIFTRKPHLRPLEFLILGAKRLLQHNRSEADIQVAALTARIYEYAT